MTKQRKERGKSIRLQYKICISGASDTGHCSRDAVEKAEVIGREIARRGIVLVTGATTGIPYWTAKGAKTDGGTVIGFSPASTKSAHLKTYRLPIEYHDSIFFTGADYVGRNLMLTRVADGMIIVCGRIGTINAFTSAFENEKPIGVLEGTGGFADMARNILEQSHRGFGKVIFSRDPADLVEKLEALIKKEEEKH